MRQFFIIILATAVAAILASACKTALPARFETFANVVEKRCDKFSDKDWEKANEQFEKLLKEYNENKDSFNNEEKQRINAAISKYVKLVAKSGVKSAIDALEDLGNLITPFLEGIGSFINDLFKGNEE
ncbi:MAG: hypothetical protein K6G79_02565 [Bacteroidales bacterium]|nr:hypothetical protein [Bacteroidales bacterium]